MESAEVLQSIAAVGIPVAGFGGIAAKLSLRARGVWSDEYRVRLVGMATASLVVVFDSFLPYAIASLGFSATWRPASAIILPFQVSSLGRFLPVFVRNVVPVGRGQAVGTIARQGTSCSVRSSLPWSFSSWHRYALQRAVSLGSTSPSCFSSCSSHPVCSSVCSLHRSMTTGPPSNKRLPVTSHSAFQSTSGNVWH